MIHVGDQISNRLFALWPSQGPPRAPKKQYLFWWHNCFVCVGMFLDAGNGGLSSGTGGQISNRLFALCPSQGPPNLPKKQYFFRLSKLARIIRVFELWNSLTANHYMAICVVACGKFGTRLDVSRAYDAWAGIRSYELSPL